tara:strand:+ start:2604 stop:3386 length:783 start_codon:yes stop_codon:yes gene_type:complete
MRNALYFCDLCTKETIDNNGTITNDYFECYQKQGWIKHLKTSKHLTNCKKIEQDPKSVTCRYCDKKFSEKGYEIHKQRNQPLWDMKKIGMSVADKMICNHFIVGKKRYDSIEAYKATQIDEEPKKRCKVGEVSQVTGIKREPQERNNNKPKNNIQMNITTNSHSLPPEAIEAVTPEEKEVEERTQKRKEKEETNSKGYCEYQSKREYHLKESDYELLDVYGDKMPFEDICECCENPINDFGGSISLFKYHLKIDVCNCEE